ncbi:MFS transporter [Nocardiopsis nanhaiensis]
MLCLCGTVAALQQTIVVPLLPDFPRLLSTTVDNASWMVTATLLAGAVGIPVVTRLADMFGKRLMLLVCLAVMIAGSVLGALTDTLAMAVTARALQGFGMALIPVGISIMRDELPRHRVPVGVALMSATLAIGAGVGLPLAGVIVEHLDWQVVFWVTAVAGCLMLVAVPLVVPESRVLAGGRFDFGGAVLLCGGLLPLLLALSKGGQWGWASPLTLGCAVGGLLLLLVWLFVELRVSHPVVDVRLAARPAVLLVNIASVLTGFAMFANMLVTTQLLQLPPETGYGLGLSVIDAGLWMLPMALCMAVLAPLTAAITRRFGALTSLVSGSLVMAFGYVARVYTSDDLMGIVVGSTVVAVGTALSFAAMPTLIMGAVPATQTASANGVNTLFRSFGTSLASSAIAAVTTVFTVGSGAAAHPSMTAFLVVFWAAGAAAALAAVVVLPLAWRSVREAGATRGEIPSQANPHGDLGGSAGGVGRGTVGVMRPEDTLR